MGLTKKFWDSLYEDIEECNARRRAEEASKKQAEEEARIKRLGNKKVIAKIDPNTTKRYVRCPYCNSLIEFTLKDEIKNNVEVKTVTRVFQSVDDVSCDDDVVLEYDQWHIECPQCEKYITTRINGDICGNAYIPESELMTYFNKR